MNFEEQMLQALQAFITEARDLLTAMEQGLLQLEQDADPEAVNALFRAAHTIKGSAGLFGLDGVVHFTHHLESLLDQMRAGKVAPDDNVIGVLLDARDHLAGLIEQTALGDTVSADDPAGQALIQRLQAAQEGGAAPARAAAVIPTTATTTLPATLPAAGAGPESEPVTVLPQAEAATATWHLSLRFGPDSLRHGMDPLAFVRYLRSLGDIVGLATLSETLPALDELDPESCYLGFEINFRSDASKEDIEAVFEFVREDSHIRILPAHSRVSDYVELIQSLPEDELRLGDILVQIGTLTRNELAAALAAQERDDGTGAGHEPLGEILVREGATHKPIVQAALDKQRQVKDKRAREGQMLRVAADKLDVLINLVGELVIASAGNALHAKGASQAEAAAQVTRLVEEIRERALKLRMVEIGETFARFQRVVRDTARELGKDIALQIHGADTEMDKSLVESIADPLMHLVRNAMDHGLERSEVRVAAGKPAQGTLRLSAMHDGGSILIEVSDDGAGLNRDRILAKAVERGLVPPEAAETMADTDVWGLIFEPGFSTAEAITDLSGRGVGMDVVRRNIESIRGTIDVHSEAGRGARIRLRLPLTLAIIDGFLVASGDRTYVLPLDAVVECLQYQPLPGNQGYINLRGEVLPLLHLRQELGATDGSETPLRQNVVVVHAGGARAGLVVDSLLGEYQTVIKPLGALFAHLRGISGSTILGNGTVALILDVPALLDRCATAAARPALAA